jgi:hypothetical protein
MKGTRSIRRGISSSLVASGIAYLDAEYGIPDDELRDIQEELERLLPVAFASSATSCRSQRRAARRLLNGKGAVALRKGGVAWLRLSA